MTDPIEQRLTTIFQDIFDDDDIVVQPSLSAKDVPAWDSLTHIRMLLTVEREFHIKFNPVEIGELTNAGDLMALIHKKISAKS
jgi:acyl carrier protein